MNNQLVPSKVKRYIFNNQYLKIVKQDIYQKMLLVVVLSLLLLLLVLLLLLLSLSLQVLLLLLLLLLLMVLLLLGLSLLVPQLLAKFLLVLLGNSFQ